MPALNLSDADLQTAAQACRIAAFQAEQDGTKQSNPGVRATFDATARRYRELAAKFDGARKMLTACP